MATQEQIYDALKKAHAAGDTENATKLANYIRSSQQAFAPTTRKEGTAGIVEAGIGGLKGLASSSLTALQAPFIGGEDAALKGIERGEQMTERPGASLDAVKQAYKKDGIFSAAGEALSQIPGALAEQSPFIGAMFAGARLGAAAGPYGALAGSLIAPFLMSSGAAMERKATEQLSKGKKVDINELGAYGTGLASAGLERAALGLSGVSKMLGINILQPVTRSAEQIARQNLAATLAKGGGKLIAVESPTEVAQQMLERYYADLPLLNEEAKKEYADAAFGAALLAPLGMAGSFKERRGAQKEIQTQEDDLNRILTEKKQTEEAEIKAREEREEITKKQADAERQQAELIRQQEKEIINAALKEAEETGQPLKPVQVLINEMTAVSETLTLKQTEALTKKVDGLIDERSKVLSKLRANLGLGSITEAEYNAQVQIIEDKVKAARDELRQKIADTKRKRPLSKKELEQKKADFKAALAAPSGQFTSGSSDIDPKTGQPTFVERELTEAEVREVPIVKGYPFPPKPKPIDFDAPITKALYKTFGVGFTANVIKETEGLDPLVLEDNVKIKTAIEKHLNRPKTEDDAPSSVKLREYLETIPSLEQLENEQEARLARDYDERTGGSASLPGESADPDAAIPGSNDGRTDMEPPEYLREPQRQQDAIDAALIKEENAKKLAAAEKKLSKETNLLTTLRKQGVDRSDINDITGESTLQKSGYSTGAIFRVGAKPFVDSLNDGVFDAYLPPDLQMQGGISTDTYEQLSEKTDKAYAYITDLIRSGAVNVKPFEAQQEVDLLSDQVAQMEEASTQETQTETAQETQTETAQPAAAPTPRIQESRTDTEGVVPTGQTAATVTTDLVKEFGNNINKAIQKGMLVIVDDVSQLPSNVTMSLKKDGVIPPNGAFDKDSGITYLIANRIGQGRARRVLLHEIGEHYGLEGMLGKDYEPTLNRLNKLKDTDETIGRIWESVTRQYPDLTVGSKPFLQEVMAKIGEDAPNNSIFRRVVSLVKEFLRKLGFINVNSLTKADLQDMVLNSLNVSLADIRSTSRTTTGTPALQMSKEELQTIAGWSPERITELIRQLNNNTMGNYGTYYVALMSPQQYLDLAPQKLTGSEAESIASLDDQINSNFGIDPKRPVDVDDGLVDKIIPLKDGILKWVNNKTGVTNKNNIPLLNFKSPSLKSTSLSNKITGHEGRHRARALQRLGVTQMPVLMQGEVRDKDPNNNVHPRRIKVPDLNGESFEREGDINVKNTTISNIVSLEPENEAAIREMIDFNVNPEVSPNLQFSIPDGYDSTAIFAPPNNANSKTFFNKFIDTFESFKNTPKDSLLGLFEKGGSAYTSTRINLAGTASGVEEKLGKEWTGAIEDGITENVRADIVLNQALASDTMAAQAAEEGTVILLSNGLAKVEKSEYNINRVLSIRDEIGKQSTPEVARHVTQAYLIARRYELVLKLIEKKRNNLETLKENIKKEKSIVKTSTKDDKKEAQKRLTRYEKQLARDVHFIESRTKRDAEGKVMWIAVSPEQQNAIAPGLALAQQHPQLIEMGEVIDGINENRINLMESSGIYSKDLADYYREQKGYVPLFRNMNEELTELDNANPGVKSHFNGFADVGKEYGFTGSEKVVDDVVGNILKQHFFSVNAAVRNNANRVTGEMVGVRDQDGEGEVVYSVKKPEGAAGNVSAPVFIDGERLFVEYPDPNIAVAIQGALPVYDGILGFFGKFSKIFRLGITSNPIFQTYQVANDAIGASLYSGVRNPLDLSKRIIAGFYKNQSFTGGNTDAIDAQMKRLGIAGGFGSTSEEIQRTASRKLGVENATKIESLYESVDKFASKSDIAQRRGIFEQTLIETGGTLQADGSIVGGNEVLAMNRALNIINWQKRGAATWVRKLTHVVPFLNAYLQGMDVLINALRGKGLTGGDAKLARALLYRNAASLLMLNLLYSLAVSGSDDYEEQDDRIKFRNYIIPGTGFKLPIRAELSLLIKYIPEQTALMISQYGREGAIDMAKVSDATLTAIADAGLSPNIFPQLIRGTVEGVTNYNFYTDRPLVGTGLSRLATEEQYTEGTSELAKLIGQSGLMSPIKFDHIFKAYTGTIGATGLYAIDQVSNVFLDNKRPSPTLKNFPMLSPLIYNEQGRDAINDFYDLKEESDEVAATLNRLLKFNPEKAREYRADNRKLIGARKQINKLTTRLRDIRTTRKRILASNISASDKRSRIERLDKQAHNVARNISKIRIRVNEDL